MGYVNTYHRRINLCYNESYSDSSIYMRKVQQMASDKSVELYHLLLEKGFPDEFCKEVAYKYMNTDYTANRMLGYLYRMSQLTVEMVVDEMFAIISDRDRFMEKHMSEQAQARISQIYRDGL